MGLPKGMHEKEGRHQQAHIKVTVDQWKDEEGNMIEYASGCGGSSSGSGVGSGVASGVGSGAGSGGNSGSCSGGWSSSGGSSSGSRPRRTGAGASAGVGAGVGAGAGASCSSGEGLQAGGNEKTDLCCKATLDEVQLCKGDTCVRWARKQKQPLCIEESIRGHSTSPYRQLYPVPSKYMGKGFSQGDITQCNSRFLLNEAFLGDVLTKVRPDPCHKVQAYSLKKGNESHGHVAYINKEVADEVLRRALQDHKQTDCPSGTTRRLIRALSAAWKDRNKNYTPGAGRGQSGQQSRAGYLELGVGNTPVNVPKGQDWSGRVHIADERCHVTYCRTDHLRSKDEPCAALEFFISAFLSHISFLLWTYFPQLLFRTFWSNSEGLPPAAGTWKGSDADRAAKAYAAGTNWPRPLHKLSIPANMHGISQELLEALQELSSTNPKFRPSPVAQAALRAFGTKFSCPSDGHVDDSDGPGK